MKQNAELSTILAYIKDVSKTRGTCFIAIDGRSGTGKSTISQKLASALGEVVTIDQDDFYVGGDYETWKDWSLAERVERTIDWRRLKQDVLEPLTKKKDASWHPYDWDNDIRSSKPTSVHPAKFVIIEGTYSARPELKDLFDCSLLVEVEEEERKRRLLKREGDDYSQAWDDIWRSAEDYYFSTILKKGSVTFTIDNSGQNI